MVIIQTMLDDLSFSDSNNDEMGHESEHNFDSEEMDHNEKHLGDGFEVKHGG